MTKAILTTILTIGFSTSLMAEITIKDVHNTSPSINNSKIRQGYIDQALLSATDENGGKNSGMVPSFGQKMPEIDPKQLSLPNDFFLDNLKKGPAKADDKKDKSNIPPIKL